MNDPFRSTTLRLSLAVAACALAVGCNALKPSAEAPKNEAKDDTNAAKPADKVADKPVTPVAIEGKYSITGTNPAGTPYKGDLEIIKHADVFQFRWDAGKQYDGVGVQQDGVVAVSFCEGQDGKGCGVACYRVNADGTLEARWGLWGTDDSGTEKATHSDGASTLEGKYAVTGKSPKGTDYKATLTIAKTEGGYNLVWSTGDTGFGIVRGDHLTVGYGGPQCGFVSYEAQADGSLVGVWGGPGTNATGSETATRK